MATETLTYDDWLALDREQQWELRKTWNPYSGENIHIPKEAGRRLKSSSPLRIVRVTVGVFHMGEYVLNAEVCKADLENAPKFFEQEFEGFRVGYSLHRFWIRWTDDTLC